MAVLQRGRGLNCSWGSTDSHLLELVGIYSDTSKRSQQRSAHGGGGGQRKWIVLHSFLPILLALRQEDYLDFSYTFPYLSF